MGFHSHNEHKSIKHKQTKAHLDLGALVAFMCLLK